MRCPQCGNETQQGSTFCSRCGARLFAPKPSDVHEYNLLRVRRSLWYHANTVLVGVVLIAGGIYLAATNHQLWRVGMLGIAVGVLLHIVAIFYNRTVNWIVTSDRIIENRGLFSTRRREMELADMRSVEVEKRLLQRMLHLGDVTVASAASSDFAIRLTEIATPDAVAETIRKARLKRLA